MGNSNRQFDIYEPLFTTLRQESGAVSAVIPLRPGSYSLGLMKSSLRDLVVGYTNVPSLDFFQVSVQEDTQEGTVDLPLSRNMRPTAENIHLTVSPDRSIIRVADLITMNTDANNNIHFTNGFEMLQFPDSLATWSFQDGSLQITRKDSSQDDPLNILYRLCDNSALCSAPPLSPTGSAPVVVVLTTPVPRPVATPVRIYVPAPHHESTLLYIEDDFDSDSESMASTLLVSWFTCVALIATLFF